MKYSITLTFVLCGALLVATPFIYACLQQTTIESLIDEVVTYICMAAGIMCISLGYKSLDKIPS